MRTTAALLSLLGGCTDLDLGTTEQHVIGGQRSQAGAFPGVGALMRDYGDGPEFGCTGTLIAPDAVLTAAHCLDPALVGPGMPGFTLALDTVGGAPVIVPGRETFKHDRFSLSAGAIEGLGEAFDIGIVLLAQPIIDVAPLAMPRLDDAAALVANLEMEIVGYGMTRSGGGAAGVMFDARTTLAALNGTELQVGNGSPQPQNCNGDSGGPGFATVGGQRRIVGIVSRSFAGGDCDKGGIDTRVDAYLPFIHSKVTMGIPCGSGMAEPCPVPPDEDDDEAGCSSTRGASGAAVLALLLGLALVRPRRVSQR